MANLDQFFTAVIRQDFVSQLSELLIQILKKESSPLFFLRAQSCKPHPLNFTFGHYWTSNNHSVHRHRV